MKFTSKKRGSENKYNYDQIYIYLDILFIKREKSSFQVKKMNSQNDNGDQFHRSKGFFIECDNKGSVFVDKKIINDILTVLMKHDVDANYKEIWMGIWNGLVFAHGSDAQNKSSGDDNAGKEKVQKVVYVEFIDKKSGSKILSVRTEKWSMYSYRVKIEFMESWDLFFIYLLTGHQTRAMYFNSFRGIPEMIDMVFDAFRLYTAVQYYHINMEKCIHAFRNEGISVQSENPGKIMSNLEDSKAMFAQTGKNFTRMMLCIRNHAQENTDYAQKKMTIFQIYENIPCTPYTFIQHTVLVKPYDSSLSMDLQHAEISERTSPNPVILVQKTSGVSDSESLSPPKKPTDSSNPTKSIKLSGSNAPLFNYDQPVKKTSSNNRDNRKTFNEKRKTGKPSFKRERNSVEQLSNSVSVIRANSYPALIHTPHEKNISYVVQKPVQPNPVPGLDPYQPNQFPYTPTAYNGFLVSYYPCQIPFVQYPNP